MLLLLLTGCSSNRGVDSGDGSRTRPASRSSTSHSPQPTDTPSLGTLSFQTPSGNIGCLFALRQLRCDVGSGLVPEPTRYVCPSVSHWAGVVLSDTGSVPNCAGDTVVDPSSPVLPYGAVWNRGGFKCTARRTGLNCVDAEKRGFTLARAGWTTFLEGGQTLTTDTFQTPSGNIVCGYMPKGLRCDLHSGLKPEPSDPCPLDWVGVWVEADGAAGPDCAGDAVESTQVLGYGRTWELGGMRCSSEATGLTCSNQGGHGFFLSRAAWRVY